MKDLDAKDKKILYALEFNARITETQLAKKVGVSREVATYRLKKLEERGYIRKYHAIINSMNLGSIMFRTYFKLQGTTPEKEREIVAFMNTKFNWVTKVRGPWDIATMAFMKSHYEFDAVLRELFSAYGPYIEQYWVAVMTRLHHCKRGYLLGVKDMTDLLLEKTGEETVDELDQKILDILAEEGRASNIEIARRCTVQEKLIRDRIKRLEERGIILCFTTFLDITKLGMLYYKLNFHLNNKSQQTIRKMIAFAVQHPAIIYVVEGMGCDDLEMELQVPSTKELYEVIDEYRSQFKEDIRDYMFMEYTEEYAFSYTTKTEDSKS